MSQIEKTEKIIKEKAESFLSGKPVWYWWAGYILLTAVLFAVFYLALIILAGKWWIVAILVIAIGFIWGTIAYTNRKQEQK
jgi:fatty acid desaturase